VLVFLIPSFTNGYIESRKDLKASSIKNFTHTAKALVKYFGPQQELRAIKVGDCDSWRQSLVNSGLAQATISKLVKQARQLFKVALRRGLIDANPFADLKAGTQRNEARLFFVNRDVVEQVIKQIKLPDLALVIYLCRYGGLRCPSEVLTLRWKDIDWATNRILVQSPKGEKHGKGVRPMPLFPELLQPLREAQSRADKDPVFVIKRYRDKDKTNLRTHLTRILKKMGIEPWPRLFHNLRASRETELASKFPIQVVTAWLGNSPIVALQHYLQTTNEHFDRAIKEDTNL
jgi:integrase